MNKLEFVVSSILIFFVFVQGIYPTVFTECLNIPFEVEFFFSALVGIPGGEKGGTNAKILEFLKKMEKGLERLLPTLEKEEQICLLRKKNELFRKFLIDTASSETPEEARKLFLEDLLNFLEKTESWNNYKKIVENELLKNAQEKKISPDELLKVSLISLEKTVTSHNKTFESISFRVGSGIVEVFFDQKTNLSNSVFIEKRNELLKKFCSDILFGQKREEFSPDQEQRFRLFQKELQAYKKKAKNDLFIDQKQFIGEAFIKALEEQPFLIKIKPRQRVLPKHNQIDEKVRPNIVFFFKNFKMLLNLFFKK